MTPLTVPEARAILRANAALEDMYEERLSRGDVHGLAELDAWLKLCDSARARVAAWPAEK